MHIGKKYSAILLLGFLFLTITGGLPLRAADSDLGMTDSEAELLLEDEGWLDDEEKELETIADPFESLNRMAFTFNDRLYFWFMKPVAKGYNFVMPGLARVGISNFFKNILFPIRAVNNLLQGKVKRSGIETGRFIINTTIGGLGFCDPAQSRLGLRPQVEDFGQTLGVYGMKEGFYIVWPFFGSSNVRDTFGLIGDYTLNPITYLGLSDRVAGISVNSSRHLNRVSLQLGEYEQLKEASFDPYIAIRAAYFQNRRTKINDRLDTWSGIELFDTRKLVRRETLEKRDLL